MPAVSGPFGAERWCSMRSGRWWLALASGVALALTFPPFDLPWPLLPIAIAGWYVATQKASLGSTLWRSLAFAMGFYLVLLKWMLIVGVDAWILLALLQSLYILLVAVARYRFERWALFIVPTMWVAQDWLRDHAPATAFGWGQLAFASVDAPWSMLVQIDGQELTTFVAALAGVALGRFLTMAMPSRLVALGVLILALTLPLLIAPREIAPSSGRSLALVQAGVDRTGLGVLGDRRSVLFRHRDLTIAALRDTTAVGVVWPENASDADPFRDPSAAAAILAATESADQPLLLGAVIDPVSGRQNVALLAQPGLETIDIVYQKQRLVPFGEFLPFRDVISRITERAELLPRDFVPGDRRGSVRFDGHPMGIVICFEIADQALVRDAVSDGGVALIVQTNNATYAGTGQSEQQLRISQLRARMLGMPVYVVSTNGPTAVINERGEITDRIDEGDTGVILAQLGVVP